MLQEEFAGHEDPSKVFKQDQAKKRKDNRDVKHSEAELALDLAGPPIVDYSLQTVASARVKKCDE